MRIADAYAYVTERVAEFNLASQRKLKYLPATAGFFLWVDMRAFMRGTKTTAADERKLFLEFITSGPVYIAPGALAFKSAEAGYFRIIYSTRRQVLEMALTRIFKVLTEHECE